MTAAHSIATAGLKEGCRESRQARVISFKESRVPLSQAVSSDVQVINWFFRNMQLTIKQPQASEMGFAHFLFVNYSYSKLLFQTQPKL